MTETSWQPARGRLMTRWAGEVDLARPLPEYPRPQLTRLNWLNLNGLWDYAILDRDQSQVEKWQGQILVPFAVESALSGVQKALLPDQRLWYRRTFSLPVDWAARRVLLHFGAVDFEAEIWLNGRRLGSHSGGYLPFTFEVTTALQPGENTIVVAVWDPSDTGLQECGKQTLNPHGIWYTAVSGIWQTVWLEPVPESFIRGLRLTPDLDAGRLRLETEVDGPLTGLDLRYEIWAGGEVIANGRGTVGQTLEIAVPDPRPWSPNDPFLYDLVVCLVREEEEIDRVGSYFAMRKFGLVTDGQGYPRFSLNNQPLFLYGPLDQGYFPDGLYTAPTDAALAFDVQAVRALGCNFIRKHVKVEPARWYYHCDQLGMIVWQDMPNGGKPVGDLTSTLSMHFGLRRNDTRGLERFGRAEPANRERFRADLRAMMDALYNSPCIAVWVPFNEGWGQFQAAEIGAWAIAHDPTRLVDATSGWFDQGAGHFLSRHEYVLKLYKPRKPDRRAFILSEFGGYSLIPPGHAWDEKNKFGYRFYEDSEKLTQAYLDLLRNELKPLIGKGLAAAVYTETSDVEIEVNGFLSYDRAVDKIDPVRAKAAHEELVRTLE